MAKAKLIRSSEGQKSNPTGKWHVHDQVKPYIQGIEVGQIDLNQATSALISGVPTPWARAKLFWFAFDYAQRKDTNIKTSGLIEFYNLLLEEWKGLIALIALYPDRISFSEPLKMDTSGKDLFEITSAFGRMLMEDAGLWTDQENKQTNPDEQPFIQLVKYRGQVIGATSPFSIVFSGVNYADLKDASDIKWYRNGRFEDPTKYLDRDKFQKLYLFINSINQNFTDYENLINLTRSNKLDLNGLKFFLRKWQDEIKLKERDLQENGSFPKYNSVSKPFKILLASEQKVYILEDGSLSYQKPEKEGSYKILSDLQDLLLNSNEIVGWYESTDDYQPLHKAPVYYLKVNNTLKNKKGKGDYLYFALPLSLKGLKKFQANINSLLDGTAGDERIEAFLNEQGKLQIDLVVKVDKQPVKLSTKEYKVQWEEGNKKVLLWPNFTSDNWNSYFMYSEFPSNASSVKFIPFFKQKSKFRVERTKFEKNGGILENENDNVIFSNSSDQEKKEIGLKANLIVQYPYGQVNEEVPAYEIMQSNKPVAGLQIKIDEKICGYLLLKDGNNSIIDRTYDDANIAKAYVGIDFGSNNSCAYFALKNGSVFPVSFSNRRVALVGTDILHESVAHDNELLFFQNAKGSKGQIKSWLHEHHPLAPIKKESDDELAGGVPVNEKNIKIERMDRYNIHTQAGKLNYNMKWLSDTTGRLKKTAYLKTIWLQICADLYNDENNRCVPEELRWSYPGALSEFDKDQYRLIFKNSLPEIYPITINGDKPNLSVSEPSTESEAVCNYSLNKKGSGLTEEKLFLGIDVGGSTSDILILGKTKDDRNTTINKLIKQSSVRIAAGVYFDAIISSARFRQEVFNFHENKNESLGFQVLGIGDMLDSSKKETAPFYLNSIFDQLKEDHFNVFYQFMGARAQFVFTIPAFVTGLLTFYGGMMVSKAIKDEGLVGIKEVDLLTYGKGGRLFFWLDTYPGQHKSKPFLESCFKRGFGEGAENIKFSIREDVREDNKSEVAMGLVAPKNDNLYIDETLRNKSDIFGERGISINVDGQDKLFSEEDILYPSYFSNPNDIRFPSKFERFSEFLNLYLDFVGTKTDMVKNTATLKERANDLKAMLTTYLTTDPEWKKADELKQGGKEFDYKFPFIIAEGLCYLEQVLIPEVFKV